jgi:hypothetical protein
VEAKKKRWKKRKAVPISGAAFFHIVGLERRRVCKILGVSR